MDEAAVHITATSGTATKDNKGEQYLLYFQTIGDIQ